MMLLLKEKAKKNQRSVKETHRVTQAVVEFCCKMNKQRLK